MLNVDLEIWAEDFRQLGREYFALVRQLVGEDAPEAARVFGFRRPEAMYLLFRMSSAQLDMSLTYSGLPFGVDDEKALGVALTNLDTAKPLYTLPPQMAAAAENLQMAYFERMRSVARENLGEAGGLFGLSDLHSVITPVANLTLSGLRKLSRLNYALRINSSVAYEMVHSMIAIDASVDRVAIAGWSTVAACGQADHSLTGKVSKTAFLRSKSQVKLLVQGA
jgi:hypothetical protein